MGRTSWFGRRLAPVAAVVLVAFTASTALPALEPWADAELPIADGLELWLDAARATGPDLVPHDGKLAVWYDASGNGRHLRQGDVLAQPIRVPGGQTAVVRFDGLDDHLRAVKLEKEADAFTIFVVAAPRHNPGGFRAVLAFNAPDGRDFETGLTLDLGPVGTPRFGTFNVEGRGFGTWQNLLTEERSFGALYTFEVVGDANAVRLSVEGVPAGSRPRDGRPISLTEVTVGARYYTIEAGPQQVAGFGPWDVAEVLVYSRTLDIEETRLVHKYLECKHAALREQLPPAADGQGTLRVPVPDPPPVQVLLPGFEVWELPVDLTNVNNVLYWPDGSLIALGYSGMIWRLQDTDADGLEDSAEVFWDGTGTLRSPIGMDLTPPGYEHGDGVFVASKTRCALIVDTDRDGKADKEVVVAEGWKESFHNVDGLGVAFDRHDGSVYFGRGTYNFADPLLLDKEGKSHYRLSDEAGAIIRVSPDFKRREIVATGFRFPVALRFNRAGDLFATDQEGATWLPNGNPYDELLHIQKGRHYGFPPRHPRHLPHVIDEPSTFDYAPQHQSTCGLAFNEPVRDGGPVFGPRGWVGDAIVTGESRGKLFRTQLVKTRFGYVARTQILACLRMLTVDCCVAPDGSLVVACHSGGPDWGSGPTGAGKLYKIRLTDANHPQPLFAWASGPREVRVEFDRPVDAKLLRDAQRRIRLTAGRFLRAGERFESIWPGYAIVQVQRAAPRLHLGVHTAQLTRDRHTLILATDAHPAAVHYALTLPGMGRPLEVAQPNGSLRQVPEIDLDYDLTGCEAIWRAADNPTGDSSAGDNLAADSATRGVQEGGAQAPARRVWNGWLPHPDLGVAQAWTAGSAGHEPLWHAMRQPGELTLRFKLDLVDMLRPTVQPGSQLEYGLPPEVVTVTFESSARLALTAPGTSVSAGNRVSFTVPGDAQSPVAVELRLVSPGGQPRLDVWFTTNEDHRPRPLQARRVLLPWADTKVQSLSRQAVRIRPPELEGGSWARGRTVFFGEQAACAKCHTIHGRGADLGPDLSNLVHRDYASVLRDIETPSFAINPDHLTFHVLLADGRRLSGVIRNAGERLRVGDSKGALTDVALADVEQIAPSSLSTMPEGLPKLLGPEKMRDLLTFLLTSAPSMPEYGPGTPPQPRTSAEVRAVLAGEPQPPKPVRPITLVLVSGPKDHGPGEHDYPAWQQAWRELFAIAEETRVETAEDWPLPSQLQAADVLVFYQQGKWTHDRAADLDNFFARGGGAVFIHYAVDGGQDAAGLARRIGLAWQGGKSKFRHGPLDVDFSTSRHPITRNFGRIHFHDESYWQLVGDPGRITLLATTPEDDAEQPLFWTAEPTSGRVFVSIVGHYSWTFDDPLFRVLVLRGIAWAAREPVDRFNDLVLPGARIKD